MALPKRKRTPSVSLERRRTNRMVRLGAKKLEYNPDWLKGDGEAARRLARYAKQQGETEALRREDARRKEAEKSVPEVNTSWGARAYREIPRSPGEEKRGFWFLETRKLNGEGLTAVLLRQRSIARAIQGKTRESVKLWKFVIKRVG